MQNLQIINPHFITFADTLFTIDVLGGVDLQQIERMICTLRLSHRNYPPIRYTLDLYNDNQIDKLIRTLCDKWDIALFDVSKSIHAFICQLESYKLERLRYPQGKEDKAFEMTEAEQETAKKYLFQRACRKNNNQLCEICGQISEKNKKRRDTGNKTRCAGIFGIFEKQTKSAKCLPKFLPCCSKSLF